MALKVGISLVVLPLLIYSFSLAYEGGYLTSTPLRPPLALNVRGTLSVASATYGGNCGAAQGNATSDLASSCDGKTNCAYKVDVGRLGDPKNGCGKDFAASYSCAPDTSILNKGLPPEAGFGSILNLNCAVSAKETK
jgi:hypothetical protein